MRLSWEAGEVCQRFTAFLFCHSVQRSLVIWIKKTKNLKISTSESCLEFWPDKSKRTWATWGFQATHWFVFRLGALLEKGPILSAVAGDVAVWITSFIANVSRRAYTSLSFRDHTEIDGACAAIVIHSAMWNQSSTVIVSRLVEAPDASVLLHIVSALAVSVMCPGDACTATSDP